MIQTRCVRDYEALSQHTADWIAERLSERPTSLVCLASGSTPARAYELLAERGTKEISLLSSCKLLKLDEWGGLPMDDLATCEHQLRKTLIAPLCLEAQYTAFESQPKNPEAECARLAGWLAQNGPIDICVLGLGLNGHLGFNEPAEYLEPHAHVATLSDTSLTHTMLRQSGRQPTYGLTLGMADILRSREILLMVSGATKSLALTRLLSAKMTTAFPASLLHLHPQVTLFCDIAAFPDAAKSNAS